MAKYTAFIPENVAEQAAKKIAVYDPTGRQVGTIALGGLAMPQAGAKLYAFGALSDPHITPSRSPGKFKAALTYLNKDKGVAFSCICGDLTETGAPAELARYKQLVDECSADTPVYAISGNREDYDGDVKDEQLLPYTGQPLYYTFEHGGDVFIMCGQFAWDSGRLFADGQLQWLYETLETNRNKRCFVFFHVLPWGDSGNAGGLYAPDILDNGNLFTGDQGAVFQSLMAHYKNVTLFHGHSHLRFDLQALDEKANYSEALGFRSVHIPSLSLPTDKKGDCFTDSEGYVVEVYANGVHLRGRDFVKGIFLPIASYWLDTTRKEVPGGMYYDEAGELLTQDLDYVKTENEDGYLVSNVRNAATALTVPATINWLPVVGADAFAFNGCPNVTKVTFERTPTHMEPDAFDGCDKLATVIMPTASDVLATSPWGSAYVRPTFYIEGVQYRRHNTTSNNRYIVDTPSSTLFKGGDIELVDNIGGTPVYELDSGCFKGKTTLTSIVIPSSVKAIEANVFSGCTGLTRVVIKGTPTGTIPETVFDGCVNLLDIYVPWAEGAKANAPWGAVNATVHYNSK